MRLSSTLAVDAPQRVARAASHVVMALPKLSASEYLRRVRPGEEVPNRVVNIHPVGDASWRAYVYTIPPGYHPLAAVLRPASVLAQLPR